MSPSNSIRLTDQETARENAWHFSGPGWAIVELFADGELAASERVELEIEPGARATYSVTFAAMFEGPGYLPRVRFEQS